MNMNWKFIMKIATGFIVVPVAVLANQLWPWWSKASVPLKVITAPIVLPITGFAYVTSFWWNDL